MPTGQAQPRQYGSPSSSGAGSPGACQSSSPGSRGAPQSWHARVDMARMVTGAPDGCGVIGAMDEAGERAREIAEAALGHPVPHVLPAEDGGPIVAASVAGDPPAARVVTRKAAAEASGPVGPPAGISGSNPAA